MRRLLWKERKVGFLALFVFLVFSSGLLGGEKAPKIKFKEDLWDFGRVKQGQMLTHSFLFQNEGDAELVIKKVRTSCGCTAALISKKKITPGEEGEIRVTFNTQGYEGSVSKYIYVESNDASEPRKQLTVSAGIDVPPRPKIELDRYSADVGLILETEGIQAKTRIRNRGELELSVECSHKDAAFYEEGQKISFPLKIPAGGEVEIEIRIPPRQRYGLVREYILLKSNDPYRGTLSLYLSGYIITKKQLKGLFAKYKDILD